MNRVIGVIILGFGIVQSGVLLKRATQPKEPIKSAYLWAFFGFGGEGGLSINHSDTNN